MFTNKMDAVKAIGIGSGIAFSTLAGGFLGYKVGEHLGLEAVGLILGLFGGLVGALYNVARIFSK